MPESEDLNPKLKTTFGCVRVTGRDGTGRSRVPGLQKLEYDLSGNATTIQFWGLGFRVSGVSTWIRAYLINNRTSGRKTSFEVCRI